MGYDELQPSLQEQLLPSSRGPYDMDPFMDLGIAETFSRSWVRTDYLLMNLQDPSIPFLGATPAVTPPATFDPTSFFPAVDRVTGARLFQEGRLVNLNDVNNQSISGLRVTVGIPTRAFTFEASGFTLAESSSSLQFPTFVDVNGISTSGFTVIPAIPLQQNGLPSNQNYILFDQGMNVTYDSNLQGTDAKLVMGALTPNAGTEVSPIIGFNYMHYGNRLRITGIDGGTGTSHLIESNANNQVFGPEVGMRMETRGKWMTLGFEPKFTFGINRMSNRVNTSQIFSPTEVDRSIQDGLTRFAPMIDLSSYARIRLAENVNLSLGYQFMAMGGVSLSERNIVWNSSSVVTAPPLIGLRQHTNQFWMQGINLGLQYQF